ncbi:MAG: carboxypeptidase regulatory-like domain-containing protein [Bacteroidales bacterium]|nr:carboxypeptidase regulatory-like domain-containing protein [Bacteroidales bacterium]
MKKTLVLLLLCLLPPLTLLAQRISRDYRDCPMTSVLADLSRTTTRQRIIFIHNDLEDYLVTQRFDSLTVADAIRACIGHYPISLTVRGDSILLVECMQKTKYKLIGRLVDERNIPVADANITLTTDTTTVARGISNQSGRFVIPTNHPDGTLHVSHVAYQPLHLHYTAGDIGTLRLKPANIRLDSVSVRTRKPSRAERKYRKTEAKIWSIKLPHFDLDTIPEKYRDAPAVVLAEYDSVVYRRVQRMIPVLLLFGGYPDPLGMIKMVHTNRLHRVRIYINSVEAAIDFSKLQYDATHLYNRGFLDRADKTVWGIRIINPNGKVRVVDTYNYFGPKTTSNKLEKGKGHIDIGPLHPGDIIDYVWFKKDNGDDYFQYTFQQRYPILHLDYRIKADKLLCIEYCKENNAPDFAIKRKNTHYLFSYSNKCIEGNSTENLPRTKFEVDVKSTGIWSFLYDNTEERDSLNKPRRHGITDKTVQKTGTEKKD